jgi:hypothetical protein
MTASTRVLLGGFYLATLMWAATNISHGHFYSFLIDHGPVLIWHLGAPTVLLLVSLLTCLSALLVTKSKVLALVAATINSFYALGGIVLFGWLLALAHIRHFRYHFESNDVYAAYFLIIVPGVAATSFFGTFRSWAPNNASSGHDA